MRTTPAPRIASFFKAINASFTCYGVSGNYVSVDEFFYHVRRIHQRWLNQRSQRRNYTWAGYTELMRLLTLEQPRIVPRAKRSL